jgi:type IV pilus assembly protein PilA
MKKIKNNKGFTLVELIVVMAIMAILVGALAPQVVKYVEKARESKDLQVLDTVYTAVQTSIASSEDTVSTFSAPKTISEVVAISTDLGNDIKELLGYGATDTGATVESGIEGKLKSKVGLATHGTTPTANIYIEYNDTTSKLTVKVATTAAVGTATLGPVSD